jgi:serine-type D-Ala-D-Ala carboxypeptidase (penicillin-binding protein 5/6)
MRRADRLARRPAPFSPAVLAVLALALAATLTLAAAPTARAARAGAPALSAKAAILVEASTGKIVYARNPYQERAIASTTKLMTVLLTLRHAKLSDVFTAPPYHALPAESRINLRAGERMKVSDLLRALLLPSANDAANDLAVNIGGSRAAFVRMMNQQAVKLGLHHTHYTTPVGLDDPGNYSSAADLAHLALIVRKDPFVRKTMDRPRVTLNSGSHPRTVVNRNDLVSRVSYVNGMKTGHTLQAGWVLVGSATRHGLSFVSVVLGTPDQGSRDADTLTLLRYGFASLRRARLLRAGQTVGHAEIANDQGRRVALSAGRSVTRIVPRHARVRRVLDVPHTLQGPVPAQAVVGSLRILVGGKTVATAPVETVTAVPKIAWLTRFGRSLGRPDTLAVLVAIALVAALVARRRQVVRKRRQRQRRADMGSAA